MYEFLPKGWRCEELDEVDFHLIAPNGSVYHSDGLRFDIPDTEPGRVSYDMWNDAEQEEFQTARQLCLFIQKRRRQISDILDWRDLSPNQISK
ncbi:MAG: hypothetical protein JWM56_1244 [Candidatus Peribacteria bacterium]|nr:hypothetical protein [Candidatus Peribacteria bacterium]